MHEFVFADEIIVEATKHGDVRGIKLIVGELAEVLAEEIESALKTKVNWDIQVEEKKALCKCDCGFEGAPTILSRGHDANIFICPYCREVPELIQGGDIFLEEVRCA